MRVNGLLVRDSLLTIQCLHLLKTLLHRLLCRFEHIHIGIEVRLALASVRKTADAQAITVNPHILRLMHAAILFVRKQACRRDVPAFST